MDWLLERQDRIEKRLAIRHLDEESLVLYDLSSTYFEGKTCPLAACPPYSLMFATLCRAALRHVFGLESPRCIVKRHGARSSSCPAVARLLR